MMCRCRFGGLRSGFLRGLLVDEGMVGNGGAVVWHCGNETFCDGCGMEA